MSFAEFTQQRIFEPLGMTRTSWRDDHTRIVKGRAIAYRGRSDGFRIEMPFENVHGNGGLLTTVGDLLKWNENFVTPVVGDAAFVAEQEQAGQLQRRPRAWITRSDCSSASPKGARTSITADRPRDIARTSSLSSGPHLRRGALQCQRRRGDTRG